MEEIISKAILSGLGFASLARDAIRQTARHLVKESKLSEEEGERLVRDFQHRAARTEKHLKKNVTVAVRKALRYFDLEPIDHPGSSRANGKRPKARRSRRRTARDKAA